MKNTISWITSLKQPYDFNLWLLNNTLKPQL